MRKILVAWVAVWFLLMPGCKGVKSAIGVMGELKQVQQEVARVAGDVLVSVNLTNGRHLGIDIINSPLADLPPEGKRAKARALAQVGYRCLRSQVSLATVHVSFVSQSNFLVFNSTVSHGSFSFTPSELEPTPFDGGTK